jgi:hypothetical protein
VILYLYTIHIVSNLILTHDMYPSPDLHFQILRPGDPLSLPAAPSIKSLYGTERSRFCNPACEDVQLPLGRARGLRRSLMRLNLLGPLFQSRDRSPPRWPAAAQGSSTLTREAKAGDRQTARRTVSDRIGPDLSRRPNYIEAPSMSNK